MSNELTTIQQQNEILQLKLQIATEQTKKLSRLEDSLFSQSNYQHYYKIAQQFAKSSLIPKNYIGKPDDIFIAMAMGYQLGFSVEQSLQDIAVINGRPCLWGDGLLALILSHPEFEYINEDQIFDDKGNILGCRCHIKRKGHDEHNEIFLVEDAKKANLWGKTGPWSQFPARMLKLRARSFAIRDKFADALRGIKSAEEVEDYEELPSSSLPNSRKSVVIENMIDNLLQKKGFNDNDKTVNTINQDDVLLSDKPPAQETIEGENADEMGQAGEEKTIAYNKADKVAITDELLDEISGHLHDKPMSGERMEKALKYLEANSIEEMNIGQAKRFIKIINTPAKQ